ncbi:MAG TPA: LysM domain-containing protein [Verrucomicrobiae bacterium]|nr:LysM domain-containing protein [Verrucomicrobiae bacterium]
MFDSTSRYAKLAVRTLTVTGPDGEPRDIPYVERRFLPSVDAGTTIVEHTVTQEDRLDNVTAKYLGDPTQFWRVCDANEAMDPGALTEEVGRRIRIAMPDI